MAKKILSTKGIKSKIKLKIFIKLLPVIMWAVLIILFFFILFIVSNLLYSKMSSIFSISEWLESDEKEITDIAPKDSNRAKFLEKLDKYKTKASCDLNIKVLLSTLDYDDSLEKIYDEESSTTADEEADISDEELKDSKKRLKGLVKAMEKGNCSENNEAYETYLKEEYIPKYLSSYYVEGAENEEEQIQKIINEIMGNVEAYEYWFEETECIVSGGTNCSYLVNGEIVKNPKVELLPCNASKKSSEVLMTLDFEDYIKGVVYAEVGSSANPETQKAQAIAARSFALTRQNQMCPGKPKDCWVGYIPETNTIRMRACENDQVYCDWRTGCTRSGSGNVATYIQGQPGWKGGLEGDALATYESNLNEVNGMVMVDSATGEVQHTNYTQGSGQSQWAATAAAGGDYYDAIISYYQPKYPNIKLDITSNCTASTEGSELGISGSTHLPIIDHKEISDGGKYNAPRGERPHKGIDFPANEGTSVYAIGNAKVDKAGWQDASDKGKGYGQYVRLAHDTNGDGINDFYSYYGHLSKILVDSGVTVNGGQEIGKVGSTGHSTGNHLHFEIRKATEDGGIGEAIDPNPTLNAIKAGTSTDFGDPNASQSNNSTTISGTTSSISESIAEGRSSEDIYYNQHDYQQEYCKGMLSDLKPATIDTSGCAVASSAMAIATLNNDPSITPDKVADWICSETKYRVQNQGTSYKLFSDNSFPSEFNINVSKIYDKNSGTKPSNTEIIEQVKNALKENKMVIASLSDTSEEAGHWGTPHGHYVVLSSINDQGEFKVLDPNNKEKTGYFSEELILNNFIGKINSGIWIIEKKESVDLNDICAPGNYSVPGEYAEWKQNDPAWGSITLGKGGYTIAHSGCAATSVAIQIAHSGTKIDYNKLGSNEFNPGTFVQWMSFNGGFSSSNIAWEVPYERGLTPNFYLVERYHYISNPSCSKVAQELQNLINQGYYIILTVKRGERHWVAVDRIEGNKIYIFDPGKNGVYTLNEAGGGRYPEDCKGATRAVLYKKKD